MLMLIQLLLVFTCILEQFIVYIYTQLSVEDISHFCTNRARLTVSNNNVLSNCKHNFPMIYKK